MVGITHGAVDCVFILCSNPIQSRTFQKLGDWVIRDTGFWLNQLDNPRLVILSALVISSPVAMISVITIPFPALWWGLGNHYGCWERTLAHPSHALNVSWCPGLADQITRRQANEGHLSHGYHLSPDQPAVFNYCPARSQENGFMIPSLRLSCGTLSAQSSTLFGLVEALFWALPAVKASSALVPWAQGG